MGNIISDIMSSGHIQDEPAADVAQPCDRKGCTAAKQITCELCKCLSWCSSKCRKADRKDHNAACTAEFNRRFQASRATNGSDTRPPSPDEIKHSIATYLAQWFDYLERTKASDLHIYQNNALAHVASMLEDDAVRNHVLLSGEEIAAIVVPKAPLLNLKGRIPDRKPRPLDWLDNRPAHEVYDLLLDAFRMGISILKADEARHRRGSAAARDLETERMWKKFVETTLEEAIVPGKFANPVHRRDCLAWGKNRSRSNNIYRGAQTREIEERYNDKFMPLKLLITHSQTMSCALYQQRIKSPTLMKWIEASVFLLDSAFEFKRSVLNSADQTCSLIPFHDIVTNWGRRVEVVIDSYGGISLDSCNML